MLLNVKPILHTPGKRMDFQFSMDLSDLEFAGRYPVTQPVEVTGQVRNTADVLELELTARTTLDAVCDRCGKAFPQEKEVTYQCLLAEELQNEDNDEIVLLEDGQAAAPKFAGIFAGSVVSVVSAVNDVVVRCYAGMANAACAAIDSMEFPEVVGTLAGDDTIFIIAKSEQAAKSLVRKLEQMQ